MKKKIQNSKTKFIFVSGGVLSSLGKGILAASLANVLKSGGTKLSLLKMDPYLNVDSGTMSPYQHGEVFVTRDGCETDLDLGHYERFTSVAMSSNNSCTSGKIYSSVIEREREGKYLGQTVQVIPHITEEIQGRIMKASEGLDVLIVEIGGTVGDIESLPFFEAVRQMQLINKENVIFIHLTYLPYLKASGEVKTKPTQHSVKEMRAIGIQPDILCCRSEVYVEDEILQKISLFTNVDKECVFCMEDVDDIYKVPLLVKERGIDVIVLKKLGLEKQNANLTNLQDFFAKKDSRDKNSRIAIVAKYSALKDAYISLIEAIKLAAIWNKINVEIDIIDSEEIEQSNFDFAKFSIYDGLVIAGGFGNRGVEGKIKAIKYARENNVSLLGICLGMQLACIEYARNILGFENATSSEFDPDAKHKVVSLVEEWNDFHKEALQLKAQKLGGTMRLGEQEVRLQEGTLAKKIYGSEKIFERHRHRYEINHEYLAPLTEKGLVFSGFSVDGLVEIVELPNHKWFFASQYHPEFGARLDSPHPLFASFLLSTIAK